MTTNPSDQRLIVPYMALSIPVVALIPIIVVLVAHGGTQSVAVLTGLCYTMASWSGLCGWLLRQEGAHAALRLAFAVLAVIFALGSLALFATLI